MINETNKSSNLIIENSRNENLTRSEFLPNEVLFFIFDQAIDSAEADIPGKNNAIVRFLQTSKSNYENQDLWKKLCKLEGPDLLVIYPALKTLAADENVNWKAVVFDVCSNEKRITSTNQRQFKILDMNTNKSCVLTIDCNKLTETKIKKLVIEKFRPQYKPDDLGFVTDKDDEGFERINIVKEKVFGTESDKLYITQEKIGVVIPADDLRVRYYGYDRKEKKVPTEWLLCNKTEKHKPEETDMPEETDKLEKLEEKDKPEELFVLEESPSEQQHCALKCTIL